MPREAWENDLKLIVCSMVWRRNPRCEATQTPMCPLSQWSFVTCLEDRSRQTDNKSLNVRVFWFCSLGLCTRNNQTILLCDGVYHFPSPFSLLTYAPHLPWAMLEATLCGRSLACREALPKGGASGAGGWVQSPASSAGSSLWHQLCSLSLFLFLALRGESRSGAANPSLVSGSTYTSCTLLISATSKGSSLPQDPAGSSQWESVPDTFVALTLSSHVFGRMPSLDRFGNSCLLILSSTKLLYYLSKTKIA